jgi:hypothetical protein
MKKKLIIASIITCFISILSSFLPLVIQDRDILIGSYFSIHLFSSACMFFIIRKFYELLNDYYPALSSKPSYKKLKIELNKVIQNHERNLTTIDEGGLVL